MDRVAVKIAKYEGGKSVIHIGDIREVLSILSYLVKRDPRILIELLF